MGSFQEGNSAMRVLQFGVILYLEDASKSVFIHCWWYPWCYSYCLVKRKPVRGAVAEREEATAGLDDTVVVCQPREGTPWEATDGEDLAALRARVCVCTLAAQPKPSPSSDVFGGTWKSQRRVLTLWDCKAQSKKAELDEEVGSVGKSSRRGCTAALEVLWAV